MEFCIELLNERITRDEYDSTLVCALAVLGVKENGWKDVDEYPPILSAMIKSARFMIVQKALEMAGPIEKDDIDDIDDIDDTDDADNTDDDDDSDDSGYESKSKPGCLQFVQQMTDRFMIRGSHSPMQWMLDLRIYGLKIHYHKTASGHVEWKGTDELLYKELQFSMSQFRGMVHGLQLETRRLLQEDLLFGDKQHEVPVVPWDSLRDNPTDSRHGWNFLQDPRTKWPVDGKQWLKNRLRDDKKIQRDFVKQTSGIRLDHDRVIRYISQVEEFREKLLVLMHITGGQPARAPEILSVRHSNTMTGGCRNIFIEDGMVVYATSYHKGYTMSGDVKIIHRYLPREVGELLVLYMWLVLPFVEWLSMAAWDDKEDVVSAWLWPPGEREGKQWTSERMRKTLQRETKIGLGQAINIQAYREIAIGISRRFIRESVSFSRDITDEDAKEAEWNEENWIGLIADKQAAHTTHVAGMVYGRLMIEQAGVVAEKRQQFRMSSEFWHRFLGFESACGPMNKSVKRKKAPFMNEAEEGRMDRMIRLKEANIEMDMKRMMGSEMKFRGKQQQIIEAIRHGKSPIVAVMATGGGKSLLFMLPAWMEQGGTTIVVVPLVALRQDMIRRCKQLNITAVEWSGNARDQPDGAAIVFMTPESAVQKGFMSFLNRLKMIQRLDRIVIDECHIVLNRQYKFRKEMMQLGKLIMVEVQIIMLTATLPPDEENELFSRMYITRDEAYIFRSNTTRTNVQYKVIEVDGSRR